VLIALVISSFSLTFIPLELYEKHGRKFKEVIHLSKGFISAGLLMSVGFGSPLLSGFVTRYFSLFTF